MGIFKKLKDNGLEALGEFIKETVIGNPVSGTINAVSALLGKEDSTEGDLIKHLDSKEALEILKHHELKLKELDLKEKIEYLNTEKNLRDYRLKVLQENLKDRKSARTMYKISKDFADSLAKWQVIICYVLIFLLVLIGGVFIIFAKKLGISSEALMVLNTFITTALAALISTLHVINSFFYGSSNEKLKDKNNNKGV